MHACSICATATPTDGVLIDGSVFHTLCLQRLHDTVAGLEKRQNSLRLELTRPFTLAENISRFFSPGRQAQLLAEKQYLAARITEVREEQDATATRIRLVYDLWPTYPPDWDERRRSVSGRDNYGCSECGVGGRLHLHHIRALSQGGTNKIENLALLCEACHRSAHGGRVFQYEAKAGSEPTTIERKIALLTKAIAERRDVYFRYRKPDGTVTQRTVTPQALRKLSATELRTLLGKPVKLEKEGRLCLFGQCHLRKQKRTFAVYRMQGIRLR